ncbi:uncharacterized protein LOC133929626 [Phragmites australis]|uniref:uncharacterized protein LOC133929626 n=1 Tax=Phragmites australis TaxID=29695 RepID=UPI002D7A11E7|nr:uncharacterized protein LOC133929626 [Phragmites australis]
MYGLSEYSSTSTRFLCDSTATPSSSPPRAVCQRFLHSLCISLTPRHLHLLSPRRLHTVSPFPSFLPTSSATQRRRLRLPTSQGRLFQVEYAMEAVKQVYACVGLRSRTHAVIAAPNKAASELSSHQRKVFRVADHAGVALAGLTADGRVLSRFLRNECIDHAFIYDAPLPVSRLALRLADKTQATNHIQPPTRVCAFHQWINDFISPRTRNGWIKGRSGTRMS